jgi:hypothetical protein
MFLCSFLINLFSVLSNDAASCKGYVVSVLDE